ncbi:hypothetical protein BR93DRAFT_71175 [Coniochaeta sp. PMI_546]|nr:hypothetical protein BR93DRAFT_71175 [Coniochaeta sp. PMI_546]
MADTVFLVANLNQTTFIHGQPQVVQSPQLDPACNVSVSEEETRQRPDDRPELRDAKLGRISHTRILHHRRRETCMSMACSSPAATTPIHPGSAPSSVGCAAARSLCAILPLSTVSAIFDW